MLSGEQVLELRCVRHRFHVAWNERRRDEWDPPVEDYDPMRRARATTRSPTKARIARRRRGIA